MAIRLHVREDKVRLKVTGSSALHLKASEGVPIYPVAYAGEYSVTPSAQAQTLSTEGLMMTGNVTVNPIPNNYGLITYNGSTITVS